MTLLVNELASFAPARPYLVKMTSQRMAFTSPVPLSSPTSNLPNHAHFRGRTLLAPSTSPRAPSFHRARSARTVRAVPRCSANTPPPPPSDPPSDVPNTEEEEAKSVRQTHATVEQAHELEAHALALADGDVHAVARECALGFVHAFTQCYQSDEQTSLFVAVGSGVTGLIGLYVASMLKERHFKPVVHANHPSKHFDATSFCHEHSVKMMDFVPSTLSFYFDVVIDALLGTGFDGGDIHPKFWPVYEMLVSTDLPIACLDVPSGWDLTLGPRQIDINADTFVKPDVLVSFGVPKLCTTCFAGDFHFVAGRHVPQEWVRDQMGIDVPVFPGDGSHSVMFHTNTKPFNNMSGESYARPGTFQATLYTKNPRRVWVDPEDDDELWDELD